MTPVTFSSRRRILMLAACAALLVLALLVFQLVQSARGPRSEAVGDSPSREGWQTIEYQRVRIDIPSTWKRLDMGDCEFEFERWARPGSPPCEFEEGAAFYAAATFDPAFGRGVRRTTENGSPTWGGYTFAGDYAVYATYGDRDVVQQVLDSAREVGP